MQTNIDKFKYMTTSIISTYYNGINKLKTSDKCKIITPSSCNNFDNFMIYFYDYLKQFHFKNITYEQSNKILLHLVNNHENIKKCLNTINYIIRESEINQNGGFIFNTYDTVYTKILSIIDIIISLIGFFPTSFIHDMIGSYQLISLFIYLSKDNYMFAFYSFITLIPGIGTIVGTSLKIIHLIIKYIYDKKQENIQHEILNQTEQIKILNKMMTNYDPNHIYTKYESLNSIENEDLLIK